MTLFNDQKFLRSLERVADRLARVKAFCNSVEMDAALVKMAHSDLTRVLAKLRRGSVEDGLSGRMSRANTVRSLLQIVSLYSKDASLFDGTVGRLRQLSEVAIELINRAFIDDPKVMDIDGMSSEWKQTRRGNWYRRHDLGFELLVEVAPDGPAVGCVAEVGLLIGVDAEEMKRRLEEFVEKQFQPAIEHQRAVSLMMAM